MDEVTNKDQEIKDSVAQFVETVSIDDIVNDAKLFRTDGTQIEPQQPTAPVETPKPGEPQPDKKEEPKTEVKADTSPAPAQQVVTSKPEGEELSEEFKLWKKAYENREGWEKTLKQKSQAIAKLQNLSPEQQEIVFAKIMPFVYGDEKIPDTPEELISEAVGKLKDTIPDQITLKDEDGLDVIVDKKHYEPMIKKAAGEIIRRYLPELGSIRSDYLKLNGEFDKVRQEAHNLAMMNGEIILDHFGQQYPDSLPTKVNDKERPSEALRRVLETGEDHPEYYKVLRCKAAAELRSDKLQTGKNATFQECYELLYGTEFRKAKQQEQIKKEITEKQQAVQPESPGQAVQRSEADKIMDEVFGGESHEEAVNKFFK